MAVAKKSTVSANKKTQAKRRLAGYKKVKSIDELFGGDEVLYNNGKNKYHLKITSILRTRKEINAKYKDLEVLILPADIKDGYIFLKEQK